MGIGIDLGAADLWVVGIDSQQIPRVTFAEHLRATDFKNLGEVLQGASTVAIDAPAGVSVGSHIGDHRLARKFQRARCSEVALRLAGISVPFASPMSYEPIPTWMATGFETWEIAKSVSKNVVETFPHAIFWRLAGRQLLRKQRAEGRLERRTVLAAHVELPPGIDFWPHDALDALACALLAREIEAGNADEVSCANDTTWSTHDGSTMWLPTSAASPTSSIDAEAPQ
jgi:predicted nuclease with RNAse H fold